MTLTVHDYWTYHNRYELVDSWWQDRKRGPFPETMIPKTALIVEADGVPSGFLAMYFYVDIGICSLEWPVTRPGLGAKSARVMRHAIKAMSMVAKANNCGLLRIATLPKIANFLKREGWIPEDDEVRVPLMLKI